MLAIQAGSRACMLTPLQGIIRRGVCTLPPKWSLEGQTAVVTGSSKGIGAAAASELLAIGATVGSGDGERFSLKNNYFTPLCGEATCMW